MKKFLIPSKARSALETFNVARCLTTLANYDESPLDQKQKAATTLLRGKSHEQDSAGQISLRASEILVQMSRFHIAQILPHMKPASRAFRPGLTVGFFCILCNGV